LGTTKDFAKEFQNPLKNSDTDVKELCETLRNKIGVFIKRRLKTDVAKDLPLKHDNAQSRIARQMPVVQLERYKVELEKAKNTNLESENRGALILKSLQAIRDISDHPYLADKQVLSYPSNELVATSAKLQILLDILEKIRSKDEKAIVFADRKDTQKMLQKIIYEYYRVSASIINGDTPSTKQDEGKAKLSRQQTIDRYQSIAGFNVIIMSPIAAGVGLNVTGANHIIHYSRHWNPAKEEQATDRAYRIGQQKDVHVYYPMAIADDFRSFDLILDELLARKKALAASTLYPTEQIELKLDETYSSVFGLHTEGNTEGQVLPLSISDIYTLQPLLFEAYIAALYSKKGFITHLTPNSNDKGVDVIAFKDGENYLIQAKQSKSMIGNNGVQEIAAAKNYFDKKFGIDFKLILLSNNDFTSAAELLAKPNRINLVNRLLLEKMIVDNGVTIQDVYKQETKRMKII
jgi:HJR/Mrr/RecB family endonuclease